MSSILKVDQTTLLGIVRDGNENAVVLVENATALLHKGTSAVAASGRAQDGVQSGLADDEIKGTFSIGKGLGNIVAIVGHLGEGVAG